MLQPVPGGTDGINHTPVVVCCAWSFTLCLLTCITVSGQCCRLTKGNLGRPSVTVVLQAAVSSFTAAIMLTIILAVTDSLPKVNNDTSAFLKTGKVVYVIFAANLRSSYQLCSPVYVRRQLLSANLGRCHPVCQAVRQIQSKTDV